MADEEKPIKKIKAVDEIFCGSCGEPIKKEAEICPHCGVRNLASKPLTTASGKWYTGVLLCTALWILLLLLAQVIPSESSALLGLVVIIVWFGLPLSLYYDIQYVRANNERWNPNTILWLIGGFIWILNILVVIVYLIKRQKSMR